MIKTSVLLSKEISQCHDQCRNDTNQCQNKTGMSKLNAFLQYLYRNYLT